MPEVTGVFCPSFMLKDGGKAMERSEYNARSEERRVGKECYS